MWQNVITKKGEEKGTYAHRELQKETLKLKSSSMGGSLDWPEI